MAKRRKTKIGEMEFRTQKDGLDYVRELLLSLEARGEITERDEEWDFFNDLIKGHHEWEEKFGCGIKKYLIGRSTLGNNIELNLVRLDDSPMDISWIKCVKGTSTSPIKNLNSAMRESIDFQIEEFKLENFSDGVLCGICEKSIDSENDLHIDHEHPTFHELFNSFLKENSNHPLSFDDCAETNRAIFKDVDLDFKNRWIEFHEENAKLRCVHNQCNLRRKKK